MLGFLCASCGMRPQQMCIFTQGFNIHICCGRIPQEAHRKPNIGHYSAQGTQYRNVRALYHRKPIKKSFFFEFFSSLKSNGWAACGMAWSYYGHSPESKTLYSTNHSAQNHCSSNQNAWIPHDHDTISSLHGMNRTITSSYSYENDSSTLVLCSTIRYHDSTL